MDKLALQLFKNNEKKTEKLSINEKETKRLSFKEFKEIDIENIKSRYNDYVKTNKEYLKNDNIIDFDLFCLINWFLFKDLKEGESTGYISNGIVMVNSCIQNYIRIYASKIIEYDLNNTKNIEGLFFLQYNFPDTLKNICFAFLGMDINTDELYNELILSKRKLLEKSEEKEIKSLYEHDKQLVSQNFNMYPIMLNYVDFIKKEILEANYRKTTLQEVFLYISSNITNGFIKSSAIKKYYYDKFLDLTKK
jgi:hypothetical protein